MLNRLTYEEKDTERSELHPLYKYNTSYFYWVLYLGILLIVLIPSFSAAASFDCNRAKLSVEKMICNNIELSKLDDELERAYKQTVTEMSDKDPLRMDQKQWLKTQRNQCRTVNCLKKAYRLRIYELKRWNEDAADDKDIFGNYRIQRDNSQYTATGKDEPIKTEDCLSLTPEGSDKIGFSFFIVGANVHTCSMKGVAAFTGSYYEFKSGEVGNNDLPKDCVLLIRIKRNSILLSDPNGTCRQYFCGARARIDGTEFSRKLRSKKECELIE